MYKPASYCSVIAQVFLRQFVLSEFQPAGTDTGTFPVAGTDTCEISIEVSNSLDLFCHLVPKYYKRRFYSLTVLQTVVLRNYIKCLYGPKTRLSVIGNAA